jgi:hypothetical protein
MDAVTEFEEMQRHVDARKVARFTDLGIAISGLNYSMALLHSAEIVAAIDAGSNGK